LLKLFHTKTGSHKKTAERPEHGRVVVKEPDGIGAVKSRRRNSGTWFFEVF